MKPVNKQLITKYHKLNKLRVRGKLTETEKTEFMELCAILLDQLLRQNSDVLKRLKVADATMYNVQQKNG